MKKYSTGFTAGTFDMFHVGHLNLLKRAKSMCDKLIVGVNSDLLVESYKNKSPLINQEERLEIVSAIKYVDDVKLMHNLDKVDAFKKYQFDVVFIGSDYKGSERYLKAEKELEKNGVKLEFLDYTTHVSSTILSKRILENEMNRKFYNLDKETY
ncbi:adenylyltransferase/cytidyltransferase family protein [Enterococcus gallinarum]|uniref:adenylyltransferase/cytidyltransferase family protein n=1 Tax=Enterococcus gallinarum TaxID=1353 RepID=UPI0011DDC196|nr:adenylyltransferase/cytidyltransferase family protein [Enterococcus gallinarum]MEB6053357.1 adenylyltransferase/cytidyltransferase family protein [Enterococcus gallinarum]TXT69151.1 glycerol-3-phosphate cytidylyltransferase [Enterococcus gallinarum]